MTLVELHPDELMERPPETLTAAERHRLEGHLHRCEDCRLEHMLTATFSTEREVRAEDALLAEQILTRQPLPLPQRGPARPPGRRLAMLAAGFVTLATASAAAIVLSQPTDEPPRTPKALAPTTTEAPHEPPPPQPTALPEQPGPEAQPEGQQPIPDAVAPSPPPSAATLFRRANDARRQGDYTEAVRLYRLLQRWHRGTREEIHSRVSLGHLLLTRLGAPERALPLFDAYLAAESNGALAEEARVGRALTLRRLARPDEEEQAWHTLLREHPNTIHTERARRRLEQLR